MSWTVSSSSTGKAIKLVPVVCALVRLAMGRSGVFGVGRDVGRIVRERVRCATRCSGVDWFPMDILGSRVGGAVGVSTLGVWAGVCTGGGGGAVVGGIWATTLGSAGGFTLVSGWVLYCDVEYGGIGGEGLGRKMYRM